MVAGRVSALRGDSGDMLDPELIGEFIAQLRKERGLLECGPDVDVALGAQVAYSEAGA
jgi:hypothetical protein